MLARLFVLIGSLVVLVLTAALVGPYFIDWTSYRSDFEREASRILGRKVTVEGEAKARLLPFPSLAFTGVKVAGEKPDQPWLSIDSFSMDAELAPLLRGELLIVDMRIDRPQAILDVGEDGRIDWTLNPHLRFDPGQIGVERISIRDGEISLRLEVSGREHAITRLDANLTAKTLAGPWRLDGSLQLDGLGMQLHASTGPVAQDGSMYLRLQAEPETAGVSIEADGNLQFTGGMRYGGTFRFATLAPSAQDAEPFSIRVEQPGEAASLDYRVSGEFQLDHRQLEIEAFRFETGTPEEPYTAEGSAFIDYGIEPHFTVRAEGQQMQIEALAGRPAAMSFERRLAAAQAAIAALPHPGIPGTVEFRLPAIVAGDTTIRQLELAAEPVAEGWRVRRFSAQLPGRSTLEADGILAMGDAAEFQGNLLLAVAQPSGFAAWLSDEVDDRIRRLGAAGLSAKVVLSSRRQSFRELELILGEARFAGEIDHHVPGDARPSMLLRLKGGELDLDGVLAFGALFVDERGAARFAGHDLDLEVEAGPVISGGLEAGHIDTALRIKEGRLEIDRLTVSDLAGASISATGRIQGIPHRPNGTLDAAILAADLAPLSRMLAERSQHGVFAKALALRLGAQPDLLADASVNLVASAAANEDGSVGIAISANGTAGGSEFTAAGSATRAEGEFTGPVSLAVSLRNGDPSRVLAALGVPALSLGQDEPAEAVISLRGDPNTSLYLEASLRGQDLRSSFAGTARSDAGRVRLEGRASLAAADIEPWLTSAGIGMAGSGWGIPVDLAAALSYEDSRLAFTEISGVVSESTVEGALAAELDGQVPQLSGGLSIAQLDLEPVLAMLAGAESVPMAGDGWADAPFAAEAALPFAGEITLQAGTVSLGGGVNMGHARTRLTIDTGRLRLSEVSGRAWGGELKGDFEFANDSGTGLLSAQFSVEDMTIARSGSQLGVEAKADLSASLTANGRSVSGLAGSLAGSGSIAADRLTIRGIDPNAFAGIIRLADTVSDDLGPEAVAELAMDHVRAGAFPVRDIRLAFTVAQGVARTPTVVLKHSGATLETSLSLQLTDGSLRGEAGLVYEAERESLVGAEPAVRISLAGKSQSPEAEFDPAPLARYLTQRALEIEQARVESMQERLLERQRLRREARYYAARAEDADSSLAPSASEPAETEDAGFMNLQPEEPSEPETGIALPEQTTIVPVRREDMPPMRLTPPPATAAIPEDPMPGVLERSVVEPQIERRSLFDLFFQRR